MVMYFWSSSKRERPKSMILSSASAASVLKRKFSGFRSLCVAGVGGKGEKEG